MLLKIKANLTAFNAIMKGQRKWEVCSTRLEYNMVNIENGKLQHGDNDIKKLMTLTVPE